MNGMKIEKQPKRQHKELCPLIYTLATAVAVNEYSTQNREMVVCEAPGHVRGNCNYTRAACCLELLHPSVFC